MARNLSVLINASNLHVGGGVQVAVSFICELARIISCTDLKKEFSVYCSTEIDRNIRGIGVDLRCFHRYEVIDLYGMASVIARNKKKFYGFDVCFTVFGPMYFDVKCGRHICGFAQPWIAYPNNSVYGFMAMREKALAKFKYFIQWQFFKRSDLLVVEQDHVRSALISCRSVPFDFVEVVSNCFSSIYLNKSSWLEIDFSFIHVPESKVRLGFLGRGYMHKNLSILLDVDRVLRDRYSMECSFIFTLDESEMKNLGFFERKNFYTVGSILASQCPSFYNYIDALIFPSLLECFSAAPIEAMAMKKPVFASGLPFVTETCKENAYYFDPLDPDNIAEVIFCAFSDRDLMRKKVEAAFEYSMRLPDAYDRAVRYLDLIS